MAYDFFDTGKFTEKARLSSLTPEELQLLTSFALNAVMRFEVVVEGYDWLKCYPYHGENRIGSQQIYVAKPYQLRRTPFDTTIRVARSMNANRGDLIYVYEDFNKRYVYDKDMGSTKDYDYEIVAPAYYIEGTGDANENDFIYAKYCPLGTECWDNDGNEQSDSVRIYWVDINNDGRQWVTVRKDIYDAS